MYRGDIRLGDTIDVKFTTRRFSTGAPFTLAGTPAVSAYVGNSTTEITAGITLSVDFDSRTGLNNVRVVASSGNGFATATNVDLVITTGTVDSVSVVGEVIGSFSIENRSAVMPTTAGRTLGVDASGRALSDVQLVRGSDVWALWATNAIWSGTAEAGTLSTTQATSDIKTANDANLVDDLFNHRFSILITAAAGGPPVYQEAVITDYAAATGLFTWAPAFTAALQAGDTFSLVPVSSGLAVGDRTGSLSGSVGSVTGAVGSVTGNVGGNVTGSVGSVVGNVGGNVAGSVGSVTGNVGGNLVGDVQGNVDGSVGSVAAGGINATSFAAGAIDAAALATDAVLEIADGVADEAYDGAVTLRESIRLANAANGAKLSGAATTTVSIRDLADTKNRVVATVDADGNRTAVTRDLT